MRLTVCDAVSSWTIFGCKHASICTTFFTIRQRLPRRAASLYANASSPPESNSIRARKTSSIPAKRCCYELLGVCVTGNKESLHTSNTRALQVQGWHGGFAVHQLFSTIEPLILPCLQSSGTCWKCPNQPFSWFTVMSLHYVKLNRAYLFCAAVLLADTQQQPSQCCNSVTMPFRVCTCDSSTVVETLLGSRR